MEKGLTRNVLVIGSNEDRQLWQQLFSQSRLKDGTTFYAVVSEWDALLLTSYPSSDPHKRLQVATQHDGPCFVSFCLIRKLCRGLDGQKDDHRNKLFALMHANVPCVNSALSVYCTLDRPPCHAALSEIASRVGTEVFPLIDQYYYASYRTMQFTPDFPLVVKVGHAEAGYGKVLFSNNDNFKDFVGCLALHSDYATAEPFLEEKEYDIRVQKIGSHYRAYTRRSSNWKTNVGTSILTEVTDIPRHWIRWAELASTIFGGLDILTVDAMHKNGKELIIEINDTASGFAPANKAMDMQHVVDLCVERMDSIWSKAERLKKLHDLGSAPIPTSNRISPTGSPRSNTNTKSPSPSEPPTSNSNNKNVVGCEKKVV